MNSSLSDQYMYDNYESQESQSNGKTDSDKIEDINIG